MRDRVNSIGLAREPPVRQRHEEPAIAHTERSARHGVTGEAVSRTTRLVTELHHPHVDAVPTRGRGRLLKRDPASSGPGSAGSEEPRAVCGNPRLLTD
jgi:hypothetical protein